MCTCVQDTVAGWLSLAPPGDKNNELNVQHAARPELLHREPLTLKQRPELDVVPKK
mgnify:CR=1 FL=1